MKRKPGRPRKFDSDEILDIVINVFWELGYEASDTETLSMRTGLTKPSLYNAFGSKEDLFLAAINRYRTIRSKASFNALAKASKPKEGIRDYFLNLAENVAGEGHPCGCLILSVAMPVCDQLPKVAEALSRMPEESYSKMKFYFDKQKEEGKLPEAFDESAAIALFQDLSTAMITQARAGAPLNTLKDKAVRNAGLVMFVGNEPTTQFHRF